MSGPCPHHPQCAACALIGTPYRRQLAQKRETVRAALAAYPALATLRVPEVVGAPRAFGYRTQVKLVARHSRRGLLLGVYLPGTHRVVDIPECPVHHPLVNPVLKLLRTELERHRVPVYDERTGGGWLRYVIVRASGWQRRVQVILVARDDRWPESRKLARRIRSLRGVSGVALNINSSPGNAIFGDTFRALTGGDGIVDRVGGLRLRSRAGSFVQANLPAARRVYEHVLHEARLQGGETVVDLYCGVGAITFSLATRARLAWGVEASRVAVLDARQNIRLNGFHNVRFLAREAAAGLQELTALLGCVALVSLNPPRKGADEAARGAIVAAAPLRIIYVSCNPASLARDLAWFADHGYRVESLRPFDLLPQTEHVECVAALVRTHGAPGTRRPARAGRAKT